MLSSFSACLTFCYAYGGLVVFINHRVANVLAKQVTLEFLQPHSCLSCLSEVPHGLPLMLIKRYMIAYNFIK